MAAVSPCGRMDCGTAGWQGKGGRAWVGDFDRRDKDQGGNDVKAIMKRCYSETSVGGSSLCEATRSGASGRFLAA